MTCVLCGATTASHPSYTFARYRTSSVTGLSDERRAYASKYGLATVRLCGRCAQHRGATQGGTA